MPDNENLFIWSMEMRGALKLLLVLKDQEVSLVRRKDGWIYSNALYNLLLSDKINIELFCIGKKVGFKNHNLTSKGKLKSCEAYFLK